MVRTIESVILGIDQFGFDNQEDEPQNHECPFEDAGHIYIMIDTCVDDLACAIHNIITAVENSIASNSSSTYEPEVKNTVGYLEVELDALDCGLLETESHSLQKRRKV
jgi:acetylglutamate synthase